MEIKYRNAISKEKIKLNYWWGAGYSLFAYFMRLLIAG